MHGCQGLVDILCMSPPFLFLVLGPGWCLPPPPPTLNHLGIIKGEYKYMFDLLELERQLPTTHPVTWPPLQSPLVLDVLMQSLKLHPDPRFAAFIYRGLTQGFHIGFNRSSVHLHCASKNHPSALVNPTVVWNHISKEVQLGCLLGPVAPPFESLVHCSPLGLMPKSNQVGRWRLIVDLSFPQGHSVNDGISTELCSIKYTSVDAAVSVIMQLGHGTQLIKIDLQDAYCMVPIHPHDQTLLGVRWLDQTYVDRALPFGLQSASKLFSAVADAIAWFLYSNGVEYLLHYLDDFLFFHSTRLIGSISSTTEGVIHVAMGECTHRRLQDLYFGQAKACEVRCDFDHAHFCHA